MVQRKCSRGSSIAATPSPTPALFTSRSMRPCRSTVASTSRWVACSSTTSHSTASDAVTQLGGERLEPVDATGRDHDLGAGRMEHPCESVTQPARRAGDDRDTSVETEELAEIEVDHGGRR